jgi:16S rRNA (cytosine967-C5)-methyltransferase
MAAANQAPPMVLRVNARRSTAAHYLAASGRAGLSAQPGPTPPSAGPGAGPALPGAACCPALPMATCRCKTCRPSVAGPLLLGGAGPGLLPPLADGARVLDACAAPGGKTAQLLERADLDLLALDADPAAPAARAADAGPPAPARGGQHACACRLPTPATCPPWWDGRPFDAILLDAPCTASGIVRRHPDVRWLRRPDDVAALAATQRELLDALWPLVAPGGRLLLRHLLAVRAEGRTRSTLFCNAMPREQPRLAAASPGHLPGVPDNPASRAAGPCR